MPDLHEATTLAALVYEAGAGETADRILCDIAGDLADRGYSLAGMVQRALERADRCACDMIACDLATGDELRISQDRGAHARGCRLNPQALQALVGSTMAAIDRGADLLIINKFGKQEALGSGFRDVIAHAVVNAIPTLVAVNITYIEAWRAFAADFATELASDQAAVETWLQARLPAVSGPRQTPSLHAAYPN